MEFCQIEISFSPVRWEYLLIVGSLTVTDVTTNLALTFMVLQTASSSNYKVR